jgi:hypothetical protein
VSIFSQIHLTSHNKKFFLSYSLAIAIEIAVALLLLSLAKGEFAWTAWIAYLVLASAAFATFIGLLWCCLWFAEDKRGLGWYVAAVLSVTGSCLLIFWESIVALLRHVL